MCETNKGTISFHDLNYKVNVRSKCCGGKCTKLVLKSVSGIFGNGLNAILGPTGSGKTSLLDILAGRRDSSNLEGGVLLDGQSLPTNFKCTSGYVIQQDIVMGMLTVRENINFAASLKLPCGTSENERTEKVNQVIEELGLSSCADTKVGSELRRGISGGEIRRTSIAMELVSSSSVLFLDEPTTGLDAHAALSLILLLKKLASRGRTIVLTIHQPRYAIFRLIDSLLLLDGGEVIYHGLANEALHYFQSVGFECEEHNNPADFFIDIISGSQQRTNNTNDELKCKDLAALEDGDVKKAINIADIVITKDGDTKDYENSLKPDEKESNDDHIQLIIEPAITENSSHDYLVRSYQKSDHYYKINRRCAALWEGHGMLQPKVTTFQLHNVHYQTSYFTQLGIVSQRAARCTFRNPHSVFAQACSAIILALIVGCIYFQVKSSAVSAIQNRVGAFFFIVMNHVFGNMAAVDLFIRDRSIFIHENTSGYYSISVYFIAKLLFDVLPTRFVSVILFSSISYWMIGLQPVLWQFLFFCCNLLITSFSATSVAMLLSASVNIHTVGTILTALIWVFMMVFSGLLVNIETVPAFLRWLQYVSIFRYSMNALQVCELKDAVFCHELHSNSTDSPQDCVYGNTYLSEQGIAHETIWDLCKNEVALLGIGLSFLVLCYVSLRRLGKVK